MYSYSGDSGPGHSEEIPLFWGTHKGKRWIKSKEELGRHIMIGVRFIYV